MNSYAITTIENKPNLIVVHVNTNDHPSGRGEGEKSKMQMSQETVEMANKRRENNIEVIISIQAAYEDDYEGKRRQVIFILGHLCSWNDYAFVKSLLM